MKIKARLNTLQSKMIAFFALLIIVSMSILGTFLYYNFSNTLKSYMIRNATQSVGYVTKNLDTYLSEMINSLKVLSDNQLIVSSFKNYYNNTEYDNLQNKKMVEELFSYITWQKDDIESIYIYNENMAYCLFPEGININSRFLKNIREYFDSNSNSIYMITSAHYTKEYSVKANQFVITIATPIKDKISFKTNLLGVMVFDANLTKIKDILDSLILDQNVYAYIIDENNSLICSTTEISNHSMLDSKSTDTVLNEPSGSFFANIDEQDVLVVFSTSDVSGWKIINIIPLLEIDKNLATTKTLVLLLIIGTVIVVILISTVISIKNITPIKQLVNYMKQIGEGNFSLRIPATHNYYEINILNSGFNDMIDKINCLIKDVYESKLLQKEAEFEALQAKINPHFINNTLHSISSLAVLGRNRDIEKTTFAFSYLLEYTIYEQNEMVLVSQEINYIVNYLNIQNIRYDGKLKIQTQIEQQVNNCYILKLLLQPLIENSILHGFDKKEGDWMLAIKGFIQNDVVCFVVEDNGVGMSDEKLKIVNEKVDSDYKVSGKSIGLVNVSQRIRNRFGDKYGIRFFSIEGAGTKIEITLPAIPKEEEV